MATIVNNPAPSNSSSGLIGLIIILTVLVVLVYLGFVYGLPMIQNMSLGTPQIDVNVNQTK